jgi:hypothetical protein
MAKKWRATSVKGVRDKRVKQYAEVDDITIEVGPEAEGTELDDAQVERLKAAGVNMHEVDESGEVDETEDTVDDDNGGDTA